MFDNGLTTTPQTANASATPLAGRSAIITGANRGLGAAIAGHFVRAGANVLLTARDGDLLEEVRDGLAKQVAVPGQKLHSMKADVSSAADCAAVVERAAKLLAPLTVLVNNAGIYGPIGSLEEVDWDHWIQAIQINLMGTVLMCRAAIPLMKAQAYGKIINLSGGGATAPLPRFSAYATSKAAVVRLTETLAEELRDSHIDVNAVAPGALNTRMLDEVLAAGPERTGKGFYDRAIKQRDEGGAGLEKGAALSVFLASAASDGISGRLLSAVWDDWQGLADKRSELAKTDVFTLRRIVPKDRGLSW